MENYTESETMRLDTNFDEDLYCDRSSGCPRCLCSTQRHVQASGITCRTSKCWFSQRGLQKAVIFIALFLTGVVQSAPHSSYSDDMDWYRERETLMVVSTKTRCHYFGISHNCRYMYTCFNFSIQLPRLYMYVHLLEIRLFLYITQVYNI